MVYYRVLSTTENFCNVKAGFCPLLGALPVLIGALLGALAVFAKRKFNHSPRIKVTLFSDRKFDIYIGRI